MFFSVRFLWLCVYLMKLSAVAEDVDNIVSHTVSSVMKPKKSIENNFVRKKWSPPRATRSRNTPCKQQITICYRCTAFHHHRRIRRKPAAKWCCSSTDYCCRRPTTWCLARQRHWVCNNATQLRRSELTSSAMNSLQLTNWRMRAAMCGWATHAATHGRAVTRITIRRAKNSGHFPFTNRPCTICHQWWTLC